MFNLTGISCNGHNNNETSGVRKMYNESFDPSYDKDSEICQGYIGTDSINCSAQPPLGIKRICYCNSPGMAHIHSIHIYCHIFMFLLYKTFVNIIVP